MGLLLRLEGAAALGAALKEMPAHEEHRKQLASVLQETENQTRSQIAEAGRAAAELRYSAESPGSRRNTPSLAKHRHSWRRNQEKRE